MRKGFRSGRHPSRWSGQGEGEELGPLLSGGEAKALRGMYRTTSRAEVIRMEKVQDCAGRGNSLLAWDMEAHLLEAIIEAPVEC